MNYLNWKENLFNLLNKKRESISDITTFKALIIEGYNRGFMTGFKFKFFNLLFQERKTEFTYYKQHKLKRLIQECGIFEEIISTTTRRYKVFDGYAFNQEGIYRECYKPIKATVRNTFYNIKINRGVI